MALEVVFEKECIIARNRCALRWCHRGVGR